MDILQPAGWKRPSGYSNGIKARGELVFVGGQIGWDGDRNIVSSDLTDQVRKALENVVSVLEAGGAHPEHVVSMTWFVTSIDEYRASKKAIGEAYRDVMGSHYPAMSLFEVGGLVEESAKVEIEATAVIPES